MFAYEMFERVRLRAAEALGGAVLAVVLGGIARGGDWPQFLGPNRDGRYPDTDVRTTWPESGLTVLWKKAVGRGFSGPVVVGSRVLLFQRVGDAESLVCYESRTGKKQWSSDYATSYEDDFGFDDGPRATPAVVEGRCYTYGAQGVLSSFALEDGELLWQLKAAEQFGAAKGFFGAACSPLVADGRVFLNVGGKSGAGVVAFDARSGDLLWKATDHEASYSSPALAEIEGQEHALFFTRSGLIDLDPVKGSVRFEFPWRARIRASVNAVTPLVERNRIFVSASYQTGAVVLELEKNTAEPRVLWKSDRALSCHYATPVLRDGILYGFHGRQEAGPSLRAVRLSDGSVLWEQADFGAGTLILARGVLWIVSERGEVVLVSASSSGFKLLGRGGVATGTVRAHSALARGRLFLRSETELYCVDVSARETSSE